MSNVIIDDNLIKGVADAVREKGGLSKKLKLSEMPEAIRNLQFMQSAELIGQAELILNLSRDTDFDKVTPTTAGVTIKAAQTNAISLLLSEVVDMSKYNLISVFVRDIDYAYKNGNAVPRVLSQRSLIFTRFFKALVFNNPSIDDLKNYETLREIGATSPSMTINAQYYLNTSATTPLNIGTSISYGVIATASAPVIRTTNNPSGSSPSNNNNQRYCVGFLQTPSAITIKTSTTSMTAQAFADLDSEKTNIVQNLYIFKIPKEQKDFYEDLVEKSYILKPII